MFEILMYPLLFLTLFFEVFLLVSFLERRFSRPLITAIPDQYIPSVAIVIPCYDEECTVAATLASTLALEYPREKLSVFVVDDGSTDATLANVRAYMANHSSENDRVHIIAKENGGKHTAMNVALAETHAKFIGCLDADSIVASDGLKKVMPIFAHQAIAAVTPGIHVREPSTLWQHLQNVEYRLSVFNRFIFAGLGSAFITPGPFSIFRTNVVRELGGWRYGHSTEDMEMALRIQEAGHLIANAPQAVVHTATPSTLRRLFRQRVRWTYGWLRNAMDYKHMFGNWRYGNLGIIILPAAIISIFSGMYFFTRIVLMGLNGAYSMYERYYYAGFHSKFNFDPFYINTSALWVLVWVSIIMILVLISVGSSVGTGRRTPPASTPLFLLFYSLLAPLWLFAAVFRAIFKTGVRWR